MDDAAVDVITKKHAEVRDSANNYRSRSRRTDMQDILDQWGDDAEHSYAQKHHYSSKFPADGKLPNYTSYFHTFKVEPSPSYPTVTQLCSSAKEDEDAELTAELRILGLGGQRVAQKAGFDALPKLPSRVQLPSLSSRNAQRDIDADTFFEKGL